MWIGKKLFLIFLVVDFLLEVRASKHVTRIFALYVMNNAQHVSSMIIKQSSTKTLKICNFLKIFITKKMHKIFKFENSFVKNNNKTQIVKEII